MTEFQLASSIAERAREAGGRALLDLRTLFSICAKIS